MQHLTPGDHMATSARQAIDGALSDVRAQRAPTAAQERTAAAVDAQAGPVPAGAPVAPSAADTHKEMGPS